MYSNTAIKTNGIIRLRSRNLAMKFVESTTLWTTHCEETLKLSNESTSWRNHKSVHRRSCNKKSSVFWFLMHSFLEIWKNTHRETVKPRKPHEVKEVRDQNAAKFVRIDEHERFSFLSSRLATKNKQRREYWVLSTERWKSSSSMHWNINRK